MLKCVERNVFRRNCDRQTDRQTDRQQADRYEHLHLQILIIPSSPHVSVPEKQEIENHTPLSHFCRLKYACLQHNQHLIHNLETNQHIDLWRNVPTR